jgi:coenzyme PQQ precursor peptide PqqA
MNQPTDLHETAEKVWESPTFREIPIAFEATSYALTEDDEPVYR